MDKLIFTHDDMEIYVEHLAKAIKKVKLKKRELEYINVYPIPRGGIPVVYLLKQYSDEMVIVDEPELADIFVDDLIDSGKTLEKYIHKYRKPFFALLDKRKQSHKGKWIVFPWEGDTVGSAVDIPTRQIQFIGEDLERSGLIDTPKRVVKSWDEIYSGYSQKLVDILRVFPNEEKYDEMVVVKDIEFYSTCEHHLLPFYGKINVSYIPQELIVGLSKIPRIVDMYSRRLQIQERLVKQIADTLMDVLKPAGVAVHCEAVHLCMLSRGVKKQNATMVTSHLTGVFKDKPETRAEFFSLIK